MNRPPQDSPDSTQGDDSPLAELEWDETTGKQSGNKTVADFADMR
jgi:hypothetical protein